MKTPCRLLLLVGLLWMAALHTAAAAWARQPAQELVVSPDGPYTTIQAALAQARDGDTIQVLEGVYAGPLVVDRPVQLVGVRSADGGRPVIDGGGAGTVVTLAAPGILFQGFVVRGSGVEPDRDHAGIALTAADITVADHRLEDVLFGIFVAQADRAVVRANEITSKAQYDLARKGDGIRLWYSHGVTVEGNRVQQARDVVMWYSSQVTVRKNHIEGGRYGIHLMYCDQAVIEDNRLLNNSVGIYTMYSRNVALRRNDLRGQRGPSGYALGFKDADGVIAAENLLIDNGAGIFMDGTPFTPNSYAQFENNILAFNDAGAILLTAVRGAKFAKNTFWENVEQVSLQGGGKPGENDWQGNYWSDYTGFDANGDSQGDIPYRSERAFENLTDREPLLRALIYSPAAQAIELAAATFPVFKPQPKLVDSAPRSLPAELPAWALPAPNPGQRAALGLIGLGLFGLGALLLLPGRQKGWAMQTSPSAGSPSPSGFSYAFKMPMKRKGSTINPTSAGLPAAAPEPAIRVKNLSKRYGKACVLNGVSFSLPSGESLARWGPNGAGKTTLVKAILGLIQAQGQIQVNGRDVRRDGKAVRQQIGYVPQEAIYYDMSVRATLAFYARLKKVDPRRVAPLLDRLGLAEHARKPVPALSGGLKQRLALAVALLSDPPLLLLDEPTANLDAKARREYLALLLELRREGKTLLFTSHRLEEVETLAERVLMLESGQGLEEISPSALRQRLQPQAELALWIALEQRQRAVALLQGAGLEARFNGRGTVVVQLESESKLRILELLEGQGVHVLDFEIESVESWN
jgi:nitrous oxidase accessory protein